MTTSNSFKLPAAYHKTSTYKTLLYTFIAFTLTGVISTFLLSSYLKKETIEELASFQAEQQAEIIFKALWQGMLQGWSKLQMDQFIHSLELTPQHQQVQLIRSAVVEDLFGISDGSRQLLAADPLLADVMDTGRTHIQPTEGQLRYLYPIVATEACLSCHTNSYPGAIHGVIDLRFSDQPMQNSLTGTFNAYITAMLAIITAICLALFLLLRMRIVQPMRHLSHQIRAAIQDDQSVIRINADQFRLREPFQLATSFNQLAQELEDYHDQLRANSYRDALTGLHNRRFLSEQLPNLLLKSQSFEKPLTLMLVDLDRFKGINDTYGHEAGDLALSYFASVLQDVAGPDDLVIRLGGDEFVVVLPHSGAIEALNLKRRLTESLNQKRANLGVVKLHLEASVGHSVFPVDAETMDQLMHEADQAMYRDKQARRSAAVSCSSAL